MTSLGVLVGAESAALIRTMLDGEPVIMEPAIGGYSRGRKLRITGPNGVSLFVKSGRRRTREAMMYRLESQAHEWLPPTASGSLLRETVHDGSRITLIFDWVDDVSRTPNQWSTEKELREALLGLDPIYRDLSANSPDDLPDIAASMLSQQTFWNDVLDGSRRAPATLSRDEVRLLAAVGDDGAETIYDSRYCGEVVHMDARRDNIRIHPDGNVYLVDWNWASRAPQVSDGVVMGINAACAGIDPEVVLDSCGPYGGYPDELVNTLIAAWAAYFTESGLTRSGKPAALTRAQRIQGMHASRWLLRRLGR